MTDRETAYELYRVRIREGLKMPYAADLEQFLRDRLSDLATARGWIVRARKQTPLYYGEVDDGQLEEMDRQLAELQTGVEALLAKEATKA